MTTETLPETHTNSSDLAPPMLEVRDLRTYFFGDGTVAKSVDGVTFEIGEGKTLGLVGESGCGKSVTSLSIMRLIQSPPGKIVSGEILFRGKDLLALSESQMRKIRGNNISMIFQEPMTSLNPVFTVGDQVAESFRIHQGLGRKEAFQRAIEMLDLVRIPSAAQRAREYPHQLSGGMRQRVMIAMALACRPSLLIADEPTTALDVTVQAQILNLMEDLQKQLRSSILMITHDLGVIAEVSDHVAVMYAGQLVEYTDVYSLFETPLHPYTHGLLRSIPRTDNLRESRKLFSIEGNVPDPTSHPTGCRFNNRCIHATDHCRNINPELLEVRPGHQVRCHHWEKIANAGS
jgi:peptide/nickel transport system ATP-binding protein/oligopeptide transport system ATP-binding protein